jgi:hypothetical protein
MNSFQFRLEGLIHYLNAPIHFKNKLRFNFQTKLLFIVLMGNKKMESIPYPPVNNLRLNCFHPFHQGGSLFNQYAVSAIRTSDTHGLIVDLDQTLTTGAIIYHISIHL